jgi:hypothetical protein
MRHDLFLGRFRDGPGEEGRIRAWGFIVWLGRRLNFLHGFHEKVSVLYLSLGLVPY